MNPRERYHAAYCAAKDADDRLSTLLRAKYGKRAGDMRYRPAETEPIACAMRAFVAASDAQHAAWLALESEPVSQFDDVRRG